MDVNERIKLIQEVGEEIISLDDLKEVLETKNNPTAYDGFEPSGTDVHIAQGLLRAININKMVKAGCKFKMLVADWHAWANNKLGGDLDNIKKVGKYMVEVWKACDMDLDNVDFVWVSDLINDEGYWKKVMQIARNSTLKRVVRTSQIMGRKEDESLQASQILYPCMQAADIFHLNADITQLGMDQRKVNVLAREVGPKLGFWKPVVVSHHMIMGLGKPPAKDANTADRVLDLKMSKSKPDSAIFMSDSTEDIKKKLNKAYCPEGTTEENPVLEYCKYIIFEKSPSMMIDRDKKFGGNMEFHSYEELEKAFLAKELHPMDLKQAVASYLDGLMVPIREKLRKNKTAERLREEIENIEVTR